ncbi:MAG TPA: hypothetical protein VGV18_07975, partial [Verrucomicrobiae bacterium]|nr:hypothetical protein [Verrucomicrobiae bacterium]
HADNFGFWIFAIAATIFFLSFYASSFARSTVQAIGVTLAICTIYVGLLYFESIPIRLEFLTLCVGSAILLLVFGAMIFCNVDRLQEEAKLWRRNVISVVAAFAAVFVCSNGIYYRVWELCLPLQPPAGRERFHNSVQLHVQNSNTIYVVAPDGRLWTETMGYEHFKNGAFLSHEKSRTGFIGGSNWVDVAADDFQAVGVQSDGTLWSIQRKWDPRALRDAQTGPFTLAKIGSETDWSEAAADWLGFLLRKRDGSLWTWGTFEYDWKHRQSILKKFTEDRAELPVQIAGPATFENVFSSGSEAFARKTDGTLRRWIGWNDTNYVCALTNEPNIENQWATVVPGSHQSLGLKSNGELFLREKIWSSVNPRFETFQLGQNAKWRTATFRPPFTIWAIRDDGTLWEWVSSWDLSSHQQRKPVQLGSWSDWISVTRDWPGLALAADGSVWAWDQPSRHIWLGPSRKPIYIGNIYEGSPPGR